MSCKFKIKMSFNLGLARAGMIQEFKQNEVDTLANMTGQAQKQTRDFKEKKIKLVKNPIIAHDFEHRIFGISWMMAKSIYQEPDEVILEKLPVFLLKDYCFVPAAIPPQPIVPVEQNIAAIPVDPYTLQLLPTEVLEKIFLKFDNNTLLKIRSLDKRMYSIIHQMAKKLLLKKRFLDYDPNCPYQDCSCFQDAFGINPAEADILPVVMNKIGMIEGKDIRSSVVGNSSHIFFIAPLTAKEKEDLGLSTSPPPPENGQDLDNVSSDEDSLDSFGEGDKENLSFLLKMYDRHSMTLIDTFGKFTLGVYTRVQIYKNTLMAVDRSTPGVNKVKIFDVSQGCVPVYTLLEERAARDLITEIGGRENDYISLNAADVVKDKLVVYMSVQFDQMALIYSFDTDNPSALDLFVPPKLFDLRYMNREPLKIGATNEGLVSIVKNNGTVDGYIFFWQNYDDKLIKNAKLKTRRLVGEFRVDHQTSDVIVTGGTIEDFLVKKDGSCRKIFHDDTNRPYSRSFIQEGNGVYLSFSQGKIMFNRVNPMGSWRDLATNVETSDDITEYYLDRYGCVTVDGNFATIYKYPAMLKKFG